MQCVRRADLDSAAQCSKCSVQPSAGCALLEQQPAETTERPTACRHAAARQPCRARYQDVMLRMHVRSEPAPSTCCPSWDSRQTATCVRGPVSLFAQHACVEHACVCVCDDTYPLCHRALVCALAPGALLVWLSQAQAPPLATAYCAHSLAHYRQGFRAQPVQNILHRIPRTLFLSRTGAQIGLALLASVQAWLTESWGTRREQIRWTACRSTRQH